MKEKYLENPCGTLSIPYWKYKVINIPSNIAIVHYLDFENQFCKYQRYFRLIHYLDNVDTFLSEAKIIELDLDKKRLINMINTCYKEQNISINDKDFINWLNHPTYNKKLWQKIEKDGLIIASGIAEYDKEINEGILEWVQVLPAYQNKGYGKAIVNSLLMELKNLGAKFVTVSGNMDNKTNPEKLYRSCGFTGNDIWYICQK